MEVDFIFLQKSAFNEANLNQISARTNILKCFSNWLLLILFIDVSMVVLEIPLNFFISITYNNSKKQKEAFKDAFSSFAFFFSSIEKIPIT